MVTEADAEAEAEAEGSASLDMGPEQAAKAAVEGGAEGTPAEGDPHAGGSDPLAEIMPEQGGDSTPFWQRTEPNPAVEDMHGFDEWREYRSQFVQRGVMKMAGADDAWAIIDLLKGAVGFGAELAEEYDI